MSVNRSCLCDLEQLIGFNQSCFHIVVTCRGCLYVNVACCCSWCRYGRNIHLLVSCISDINILARDKIYPRLPAGILLRSESATGTCESSADINCTIAPDSNPFFIVCNNLEFGSFCTIKGKICISIWMGSQIRIGSLINLFHSLFMIVDWRSPWIEIDFCFRGMHHGLAPKTGLKACRHLTWQPFLRNFLCIIGSHVSLCVFLTAVQIVW